MSYLFNEIQKQRSKYQIFDLFISNLKQSKLQVIEFCETSIIYTDLLNTSCEGSKLQNSS